MKWLLLFLSACTCQAGVRIGSEALLSRTTDQEYFARMNRIPTSNSVQRLNPPIFQYPYYEDPGTLTNWGQIRSFQLQITTNGSFASPLYSLLTSNIYYNFLPSITNADGSTWSNSVSWRVIYYNSNQSVAIYTNPVHTFTMPASADKWDRSWGADQTYRQSLSNLHPRILVKSTNISAYRAFVNSGSNTFGSVVGTSFTDFTNSITALGETYWTNDPAVMVAYPYLVYVPGALQKLGAAYWGVTNAWFTNAVNNASPSVGQVLTNFCGAFEALGYDRLSLYDGQVLDTACALPMCYDLFFPLMNSTERAAVLRVMENCAAFQLYESWYFRDSQTNLDRVYGNRNLYIGGASVVVQQESHARHDRLAIMECLGGMGDSPKLDYYAEYFLGFWLSKYDGYDMSHEDPRVYGWLASFADWDRFQAWPLACTMFYDKKLTNAPVYTEMVDLQLFQTPMGFRSTMQPWGPVANFGDSLSEVNLFGPATFGVLAHMNQRGDWWRAHKRANEIAGSTVTAGDGFNWMVDSIASYWPTPTQADRATNSYIDAARGWAIGLGTNPTSYGVVTDSVFFVFQARPTGNGYRGGYISDGNIEIGAYGANVTHAGASRYESAAVFFNGLFVDGIGVNNGSPYTPYPIHARIDATTNFGDGLYVRGDLTYDMNLRTNLQGGGTANMQSTLNSGAIVDYLQVSNARPYISSVKRSVLFPHNKYFVFYDQLQTTQTAMFQWKWNAYPTNCTLLDTNDFSFHYSVTNNWTGRSNVAVYVQHIVNPGLMGVTQMVNAVNQKGSNEFCYAKMNPFTHENYAFTNDQINSHVMLTAFYTSTNNNTNATGGTLTNGYVVLTNATLDSVLGATQTNIFALNGFSDTYFCQFVSTNVTSLFPRPASVITAMWVDSGSVTIVPELWLLKNGVTQYLATATSSLTVNETTPTSKQWSINVPIWTNDVQLVLRFRLVSETGVPTLSFGHGTLFPSAINIPSIQMDDYIDPYWSNTIWVYNKTPATNWHFLSVVYPVKNGDAPPTITRIDDYTVKVVTADFTDTNTFDTNYQSAFTFMVDIGATNAPPSPPPPPPSAVTLARAGGKTKHSGTSLR